MYPARTEVLPAVAIFTFCSAISGYLSVIGMVLAVATTLTAYKFAFEILQHHANGWEDPPEAMMTVHGRLVFQYLFVLIACGAIYWLANYYFGAIAGVAVLAIICLIQPGYTMVTVLEGSVVSAMNPAKWLRLMQILGNGYFLLAMLLFSAKLLEFWLSAKVFSFLPDMLATAIVKAFALWVLFASAYWMGYLIYQYHDDLGFEPNAHTDQAIRGLDRDDMLIQDIETAMATQNYEACIAKVTRESRERVLGFPTHAKYREMLIRKGDMEEIRQHAKAYLHQLLTEKQTTRAMSLAIQQFSIDPDFVPLDGDAAYGLAKEARRIGQAGVERKLLAGMLKTFPDETVAGDWAIRLGEILKQAGEPPTEVLRMLDAALAVTRSANQKERLASARQAISES